MSGSTRKLGRQKGGGGARRGDINSPVLVGGARVFGPQPRDYGFKLNKKVRRIAMTSALSTKVAGNEMIVVDAITAAEYKTKTMAAMLSAIGAGKKTLVVLPAVDEKVQKSLENIPGVKVTLVNTLCVYDILNCNSFVIAKDAVAKLEEVYA